MNYFYMDEKLSCIYKVDYQKRIMLNLKKFLHLLQYISMRFTSIEKLLLIVTKQFLVIIKTMDT